MGGWGAGVGAVCCVVLDWKGGGKKLTGRCNVSSGVPVTTDERVSYPAGEFRGHRERGGEVEGVAGGG